MTLSHWADAASRDAYRRAYELALGLWPIPYERGFIETPHGTTHVVTAGLQGGKPLVLLPAASLSSVQWHAQAAALGARYRLHAVDIVGDIGCSSQTRPMHSRKDAAEWLGSLLDGLGLARASLIGSSFGGFLATNLAVHAPARVQTLVLLAPAATLQPFSLMARLLIRLGGLVPLPATVRPGLRGMMDGELPDERLVALIETGVKGFRYDPRGIFPSEIPDDELRRLRCATLVLVGEHERIYGADAAVSRARRLVDGVIAEIVPGLGHLPGLQHPSLVNTRILDFLDQPT